MANENDDTPADGITIGDAIADEASHPEADRRAANPHDWSGDALLSEDDAAEGVTEIFTGPNAAKRAQEAIDLRAKANAALGLSTPSVPPEDPKPIKNVRGPRIHVDAKGIRVTQPGDADHEPKAAKDFVFVEQAPSDRWACAGCNVVFKHDPGPFHSHEHPVAGSKSRKTYTNHAISKVPSVE